MKNPFDITKAVDFSDEEIGRTFVEYPGQGFRALTDPTDAMPTIMLGGKGGGRTHLLRHFSFALQKARSADLRSLVETIHGEGYLGVYFRCTGLNSGRFVGKGIAAETWAAVFAYYMDLELSEHLLKSLIEINQQAEAWSDAAQIEFVGSFMSVFDAHEGLFGSLSGRSGGPFERLLDFLVAEQKAIDREVNRAVISHQLNIDVRSAPGRLIFQAAAAAERLPRLAGIKITYLIDEFENLREDQQVYVNSLIREKETPSTFLVGSRTWGFRTRKTWSADEEIKEGSEYELVVLEDAYRASRAEYRAFCKDMVLKRIRAAGRLDATAADLGVWFRDADVRGPGVLQRSRELVATDDPENRVHLRRLRMHIDSPTGVRIARQLSVPDNPIVEKLAILEFYRDWYQSGRPRESNAKEIGAAHRAFAAGSANPIIGEKLRHWGGDLLAQLVEEAQQDQVYAGVPQFLDMSGYLPRNLLVLLKFVTTWANRYGEDPFRDEVAPISRRALVTGVIDSARWFRRESNPGGQDGVFADQAIQRLGSFLRSLRFSPKPTELSCASFSTSLQGVSPDAQGVIETCVLHSLLIRVDGGRRDRNSGEKLRKYQLHPMLAPLFDLPTARRAVAVFSAEEMNAIFDPTSTNSFYSTAVSARLTPMRPPFARRANGDLLF